MRRVAPALLAPVAVAAVLAARPTGAQTAPPNGPRPGDLRAHAIVDARIVVAPGEVLERATVVIRDGVIESVGFGAEPPADARVWPGEGLTVYPGLIDAALLVDLQDQPRTAGSHWNARVRPERSMADAPPPDEKLRASMRRLGFTVAACYPAKGALRGTGVVLALAESDEHVRTYRDGAAMAAGFDHGGGWRNARYPGSLMGGIALVRQTLYDAQWHAACRRVWADHPVGNEPPIMADALVALGPVLERRQPLLFDVDDELDALRAARIGQEFALEMMLLGSGLEFRRLDEIIALELPLVVPLKFPERPNVSTLDAASRVSLREMMTWEQAPTNVRRLLDSGATVAVTTARLEKRGDFAAALHRAVRHGLSEDDALAALTTTPAALLGVDDLLGTVEAGKAANLVVVEGSLFEKKPAIRATWVNGRRTEIERGPDAELAIAGVLRTDEGLAIRVEVDPGKPAVKLRPLDDAGGDEAPDGDDEAADASPRPLKAKKVIVQGDQLAFVVDGRLFDAEGWVRLGGVMSGGTVTGRGTRPDGSSFGFSIEPNGEPPPADDERGKDDDAIDMPPQRLVVPLGAYGLDAPPAPREVVVTNATIWTCGPLGVIEDGSLYVRDGRIEWVGPGAAPAPDGVEVIDAAGRHVTPGLIDCHSHTGISGGVNEWTQANTAEVRIGDCIDPDDVNWYRQLAGGLVVANQLHGSANPIGGQNSVVKAKWGAGADEFPIADAIAGIKFALGENVKRREGRYPSSRMGVETYIRDAFTAAGDYRRSWDAYLDLPSEERARVYPPRRDLELDALVEILDGRRLIHCHSYRQDEILMLIRVADDLGFTIGTFQHVLEGYKVADAITAHGAGASSFSDWWAYKMEVMDAIPFNGALMHDLEVLVSFNSDSNELARRMNTEAAKAVRYGGVAPGAALAFVALNPARQLRIDHRVGSLETGKDADFVIWSANPLSSYARCEQTWIEGARYFDLEADRRLRAEAAAERTRLVQKILADAHGGGRGDRPDGGDDAGETPARRARPAVSAAWRDQLAELVRQGEDLDEIHRGVCGCSELDMHRSQEGSR
ncbi:MAG: amidohydrolase family protein [Planctomycetota bacterium]|jgi:N-acetylglucosamine-6-phosphate deacetylase